MVQRQRTEARDYANPGGGDLGAPDRAATVTLPDADVLEQELGSGAVVVLPGSVATVDRATVGPALARTGTSLLIAPPGLTDAQRQDLAGLPPGVVTVEGRRVSGGVVDVLPGTPSEWYASYAANDVTGLVLTAIAAAADALPSGATTGVPEDPAVPTGPAPTAAQQETALAALSAGGRYQAPGAAPLTLPGDAAAVFGATPLLLAFPASATPPPDYLPAVTGRFPGRPILLVVGTWVGLRGTVPGADTTELDRTLSASLYSDIAEALATSDFPAQQVLSAFVARAQAFARSGVFGRPLPSTPFDPLAVTLPALPFVFAALVVAFLVLTAWRLRPVRPGPDDRPRWVRLGRLSELSVEVSGLLTPLAVAPYARGVTMLTAAADALRGPAGADAADRLLGTAADELDEVARLLDRPEYRPAQWSGATDADPPGRPA